ncbi:aspartyl protease family protein [Catalinimonas niigatensis]|uniref:aspartyl protease family protein n=1 Tax=Catalinimonas niigatensis TaxID=1397264 RepID=UPI002666FFB0|nr:aspartyl protease family protein [Catalinimonas niigatensis]WPP53440.1 aspartyl protease family protein [Catalinimonas niigatensis]
MKKLTARYVLLLLFTLGGVVSHAAWAQFVYRGFQIMNKRMKRVEIPFEMHSNLIVVPIKVNDGEQELKFILDTGVRTAILTNDIYVEGIPSPNDRVIHLMGAGKEGQVSAFVSNNISFALPEGVEAEGNAMLVLQEDYLQLDNHLGVRIHGILGYEIFSRFVVEVDYINQKLILHRPEHFKPRRSYREIPMTIEDTKPYITHVQLKVNDSTYVPIKLMVDTGASHSLLLDMGSHEQIKLPEKTLSGYLGRGLSGEIYGYMGRIEALRIDKYELEGIITSFPEDSSMVLPAQARTQHQGNIGGSVLKRFRVVFDYANEKMYLRKNRLFRKDFEYNMSGMELIATGPLLSLLYVAKITDDTPADRADLREGDMIISVNGRRPPELNLGVYSSLVNKRPGKRIRLKILRNGKTLKKSFRLERVL